MRLAGLRRVTRGGAGGFVVHHGVSPGHRGEDILGGGERGDLLPSTRSPPTRTPVTALLLLLWRVIRAVLAVLHHGCAPASATRVMAFLLSPPRPLGGLVCDFVVAGDLRVAGGSSRAVARGRAARGVGGGGRRLLLLAGRDRALDASCCRVFPDHGLVDLEEVQQHGDVTLEQHEEGLRVGSLRHIALGDGNTLAADIGAWRTDGTRNREENLLGRGHLRDTAEADFHFPLRDEDDEHPVG
mmetsp:Transcript_15623/g.29640  ORF Transcript_15623/g.29640 Transcript_15623/m.29640 type:complete len:242 (-) Transcript_15623:367-1092(-)